MSNTAAQTLKKHFMENPINAYHFIRRLHVTWQDIISTIDCEHCALTVPLQEFQIRVKRIEENSQLDIRVSTQDMQWAALGIVRLWQTYKLNLQSLFRGDILGTRASSLSLDDILFICTQMDQRNDFYKEIVWLQELLKEPTELEHPLSTKNITRVTRMLAGAYSKYGMPWKSLDILEKHLSEAESNDHKKLKRDLAFFKTKLSGVSTTEEIILEPRYEDREKEHYEALCRGHVPRKIKIMSRLRCIYRKTSVPIYRAKEEILNYDPRISLFHDVLSDSEIEAIKAQAASTLKASTIAGGDNNRNIEEFEFRISQTAWLADYTSDLVKKVSSRVGLITGLSTQQFLSRSHAEDLQVLNYGVGGMYEAHYDFFDSLIHQNPFRVHDPRHMQGTGDRMATWMFYLNDVTAGGATVFLNLNITVQVEKGAAAFWYNIKRNGDLDHRTRHAGCPVLLGSKWVANKWIRQHGQILRRKCGRTINSSDTLYGL